MLPLSPLFRSPKTFIIEGGKILRDNSKQGYTAYFARSGSAAVIFERKCVPSAVAVRYAKVLIHGVNDVRITIVHARPSNNHHNNFIGAFRCVPVTIVLIGRLRSVRK